MARRSWTPLLGGFEGKPEFVATQAYHHFGRKRLIHIAGVEDRPNACMAFQDLHDPLLGPIYDYPNPSKPKLGPSNRSRSPLSWWFIPVFIGVVPSQDIPSGANRLGFGPSAAKEKSTSGLG